MCAVYWEYQAYFDHPYVQCRFDNFIHILLQTAFTSRMVPRMGVEATYFRGGNSIMAVFRDEHSKYLRVQHS